MPSHSMDLPVPRGISILMLDGKVYKVLLGRGGGMGGQSVSDGTVHTFVSHVVSMFQ